jgi:hypothetical protein
MYSQKLNFTTSFPIPKFMYLWAIYIFPRSVRLHVFAENEAAQFISGNICFAFSVQCLCSKENYREALQKFYKNLRKSVLVVCKCSKMNIRIKYINPRIFRIRIQANNTHNKQCMQIMQCHIRSSIHFSVFALQRLIRFIIENYANHLGDRERTKKIYNTLPTPYRDG